MNNLHKEQPVEYPKGTSPLSGDQIGELSSQVPGWTVTDDGLQREFQFEDFAGAFGFLARVALVAEGASHHPDMFCSWNRVKLTFWTHTAEGLTRNDFIMAAKVDRFAT